MPRLRRPTLLARRDRRLRLGGRFLSETLQRTLEMCGLLGDQILILSISPRVMSCRVLSYSLVV